MSGEICEDFSKVCEVKEIESCYKKKKLLQTQILLSLQPKCRHIDSACFETGLTLKCRNALGFDFTATTHLCFSEAFYMYILALLSACC